MVTSNTWLEVHQEVADIFESQRQAQRRQRVLSWTSKIPELLNPSVSISAIVDRVIELQLVEDKSWRTIFRWIKETRETSSRLSDEEIFAIYRKVHPAGTHPEAALQFARAIEEKLLGK